MDQIKVLLISGRVVKEHDYSRINPLLKTMLESTGKFEVKITEEFAGATAKTLEHYDLVLMNYDGKEWLDDPKFVYWGEESEEALCGFVASGHGIVFYHSSFSLGKETPDSYWQMMGGGHNLKTGGRRNPKSDFIVRNHTHHPITEGLSEEWMVTGDDFLPVVTWHPKAQVEILADVYDGVADYQIPGFPPPHLKDLVIPGGDVRKMPQINMRHPVAWTNQYGEGRAFVITIGHDIDTLRRINYLTMFVRGAEWAATGQVTIQPPKRSGEARLNVWPYYDRKY